MTAAPTQDGGDVMGGVGPSVRETIAGSHPSGKRLRAQVTRLVILLSSYSNVGWADVSQDDVECSVTYDAPAQCPDIHALQRAIGPHFRAVPATESCDACVAHVQISQDSDEPGTFVLQTGDEPTRSEDCTELVQIAGFTVRSSHIHHARTLAPEAPRLKLGVYGGRLFSDSPQWIVGGQVAVRVFERWQIRPHAGWTPPNTVRSPGNNLPLDFQGYQAGLDVCRGVFEWGSVCALSELQWFTASPRGQGWTNPTASQWMVGLGTTLHVGLFSGLEAQLQPALLFAPRNAQVKESDWSTTLYERPEVQVQVRAAISWGFGGTRTSEAPRSNFAQWEAPHVTHQ